MGMQSLEHHLSSQTQLRSFPYNENRMDSYRQTILFIVLISPCAGIGHRCACSKNLSDCSNINQMPVDFQTANEKCKEQGGHLMSVRSNKSDKIVGLFLENMIGDFWIGLHLPEGKCSSNTSGLRGYEWTSGAQGTEFTNWERESAACAPLCVSVSSDRRWVERSCEEKLDGFLCESVQTDICTASKSSNVVILDDAQCGSAPCEHRCAPVSVGYTCSCGQRFIPNAKDPRRCDPYCPVKVCEALCSRDGSNCWCPAGFVRSGKNCEDIDECESNHGCAHKCINTVGSYRCACFHPFVLVEEHECTMSPPSEYQGFTPPSSNLVQGSLSTPGEYVGLIIFIVVALFALLVLVRYLRKRKNVVQECNPPDDAEFLETVSK